MVVGVGVDLVQTERVARALVANGAGFEEDSSVAAAVVVLEGPDPGGA